MEAVKMITTESQIRNSFMNWNWSIKEVYVQKATDTMYIVYVAFTHDTTCETAIITGNTIEEIDDNCIKYQEFIDEFVKTK